MTAGRGTYDPHLLVTRVVNMLAAEGLRPQVRGGDIGRAVVAAETLLIAMQVTPVVDLGDEDDES
ncbi:hypothetical protein [Fodinicola feengrottensis]|uniref:Uncharacterized protein n=1 Tax=Fodinicola feengrottensis TaxID=435914 RepID=A0ABN2IVH6_9ACTN|nr:hypothetical protein [Fodinicola feengrottensis]